LRQLLIYLEILATLREGDIHRGRTFGDGEGGGSGDEKKSKMGRTKTYLSLTLVITMLKICKD